MSTLSVAVIRDVQSFDFSNTEFAKAFDVSNAAFDQSNTAAIIANTTNTFAYGVAVNAAAAFAAANNVGPQLAPAFNTANAAYTTANDAYTSSNSANSYADATYVKLTAPNQTITGDLSVTGALTILGNTTSISSNNLIVGDSMIYLAANNYSGTDILDIGFVANYANGTGANVHTGLIRDATNKQYYLFQGLDIELYANNNAFTPDANGAYNAVLVADLITSNLVLGGANAINWINAAYVAANNKVSSVTGTSGRITSSGGTTPAIDLATAGPGAGSYTSGISALTLDAYGRVTAVTGTANYVVSGGALGTPSSGTLTNCTFPTLNQNTTGSAATFTSTTQNSQFNSLGVNTAASGTAGEIRATNNITAYYSDIRLKTDITLITNAVEKIKQISGVNYRSNDIAAKYGYTDQSWQVGVLAQDVQKVLPEAVKAAPFDTDFIDGKEVSISGENYLTVQYEKMIPLLIEAIKELKTEIDELRKK